MSVQSRRLTRTYSLTSGGDTAAYAALIAKIPNGVEVLPDNGVYTKPASGVPVYVLSAETAVLPDLPADWEWVISDQEWLANGELGTAVYGLAGPVWTETDAGGNANAGSTPVQSNGEIMHAVPSPITYGRSETVWYDGVDGTNFRPVSGDRLRISLDFKGQYIQALTEANNNSWFSLHQYLGRSLNGSWPYAPLNLMVEGGSIKLKGQPGSVNLYGTVTYDYTDNVWYRYEEDILLGGTATGTVSAWLNAQELCLGYKPMIAADTPGYGTFYEGTGDTSRDLSFVYVKSGLYCGRDGTLVNDTTTVWTRNRRWTWTQQAAATTTTWREASSVPTGTLRLHWRNAQTGIISPVLDT